MLALLIALHAPVALLVSSVAMQVPNLVVMVLLSLLPGLPASIYLMAFQQDITAYQRAMTVPMLLLALAAIFFGFVAVRAQGSVCCTEWHCMHLHVFDESLCGDVRVPSQVCLALASLHQQSQTHEHAPHACTCAQHFRSTTLHSAQAAGCMQLRDVVRAANQAQPYVRAQRMSQKLKQEDASVLSTATRQALRGTTAADRLGVTMYPSAMTMLRQQPGDGQEDTGTIAALT